jgi:hypothetical protein
MAETNHRDGGNQPSRCSKPTIAMIELFTRVFRIKMPSKSEQNGLKTSQIKVRFEHFSDRKTS